MTAVSVVPATSAGISRKNLRVVVGAAIILSCIGWLAYTGIRDNGAYYQTVAEYSRTPAERVHRGVRVTGLVVPGTIVTESDQRTVHFVIHDEHEPAITLPVAYTGLIPDTFKDGRQVVLEGRRDPQGTFQAEVLLAKCPSKYEARSQASPMVQ